MLYKLREKYFITFAFSFYSFEQFSSDFYKMLYVNSEVWIVICWVMCRYSLYVVKILAMAF